jgi:hypothetical protein
MLSTIPCFGGSIATLALEYAKTKSTNQLNSPFVVHLLLTIPTYAVSIFGLVWCVWEL